MSTSVCARPFAPSFLLYGGRRRCSRAFTSSHLQHSTTISNKTISSKSTLNASTHRNSLLQTLSSQQKQQISLYTDVLLEWNKRMNLTAVKEEEVMSRHVEDSLSILSPLQQSYVSQCGAASFEKLKIVDVGTGAGLPGLVFAIACPGWQVTLLESMKKRCLFLEHAVEYLELSNVQILCDRAENAGKKFEYRQMFDVAVARAVAEMRVLAEYCLPLVRVGGLFVAAKGHDPKEEIKSAENTIRLMGASVVELCPVESHSPHGQRTAIICLKHRNTPKKYPRQPGMPSKTPL